VRSRPRRLQGCLFFDHDRLIFRRQIIARSAALSAGIARINSGAVQHFPPTNFVIPRLGKSFRAPRQKTQFFRAIFGFFRAKIARFYGTRPAKEKAAIRRSLSMDVVTRYKLR
jgi:hypothetical protein